MKKRNSTRSNATQHSRAETEQRQRQGREVKEDKEQERAKEFLVFFLLFVAVSHSERGMNSSSSKEHNKTKLK